MCAKLRTVAASNNKDHAPQSLLLLLARATYIMVLFFTHIPFVVNHTINATPPERLQQCYTFSGKQDIKYNFSNGFLVLSALYQGFGTEQYILTTKAYCLYLFKSELRNVSYARLFINGNFKTEVQR